MTYTVRNSNGIPFDFRTLNEARAFASKQIRVMGYVARVWTIFNEKGRPVGDVVSKDMMQPFWQANGKAPRQMRPDGSLTDANYILVDMEGLTTGRPNQYFEFEKASSLQALRKKVCKAYSWGTWEILWITPAEKTNKVGVMKKTPDGWYFIYPGQTKWHDVIKSTGELKG